MQTCHKDEKQEDVHGHFCFYGCLWKSTSSAEGEVYTDANIFNRITKKQSSSLLRHHVALEKLVYLWLFLLLRLLNCEVILSHLVCSYSSIQSEDCLRRKCDGQVLICINILFRHESELFAVQFASCLETCCFRVCEF